MLGRTQEKGGSLIYGRDVVIVVVRLMNTERSHGISLRTPMETSLTTSNSNVKRTDLQARCIKLETQHVSLQEQRLHGSGGFESGVHN